MMMFIREQNDHTELSPDFMAALVAELGRTYDNARSCDIDGGLSFGCAFGGI